MKINITIRYLVDNFKVAIDKTEKLFALKDEIQKMLNIDPETQILTFQDRMLTENHKELVEFGIDEGSVIYLKKRKKVEGEKPVDNYQSSMMKNPLVKNFFKNPDSMKNILEMFPGLKDEMNENSELRMMMNNPNLQEELANMSENPSYMSEQMKNFDLAVSKLENMPGGFNMINSILKDVQDPLSSMLVDNLKGGSGFKEGKKIDSKINEPIPGPNSSGSTENKLLKYRQELSFLRAMGFENSKKNLEALVKYNGDVNMSVESLRDDCDKI